MWVIAFFSIWIVAWLGNIWLASNSKIDIRIKRVMMPFIFGATIVALWEIGVTGSGVSPVILPPPSMIMQTFFSSLDILWFDFVQTVLKGAIRGLILGTAISIVFAVAIDRSPFLRRGFLPIGNFFAAVPIIGVAPIMVSWFGFDWHSKVAVVVIMVFFPMLVNATQGLQSTDQLQRDLMKTYAASYFQTLFKLRLPAAMPFIFNGLKIAAALSLIGAIVAEYFGSPTRGMGFRISTGVGNLSIDLVWAEIFVAAMVGTSLFVIISWGERKITFWHPSQRKQTNQEGE
jgi:NitT/TauT family transport system permease protein